MEEPYIIKTKTVVSEEVFWNPKYDQNKMCECGHKYYRHFDSYDEMFPCGCKYCECYRFKPL